MDKVRNLAVRILSEVNEEGAYANVALARNLKKAELTEVDRRFLTELSYGAVKAGGTLDWMIRHYVNRPIRKIPPMIRNILRLGFYQLFYMDKVPPSAACNESVELAKKYGHPGIVKFVNAVLRAAVRAPESARSRREKAMRRKNWRCGRFIHSGWCDVGSRCSAMMRHVRSALLTMKMPCFLCVRIR